MIFIKLIITVDKIKKIVIVENNFLNMRNFDVICQNLITVD